MNLNQQIKIIYRVVIYFLFFFHSTYLLYFISLTFSLHQIFQELNSKYNLNIFFILFHSTFPLKFLFLVLSFKFPQTKHRPKME